MQRRNRNRRHGNGNKGRLAGSRHFESSQLALRLAAREQSIVAMGVVEKIKEIEAEMARTQKNKATEYHLGQLKAKLAKLRTELQEPAGKGGSSEQGFEVQKAQNHVIPYIFFFVAVDGIVALDKDMV